jgi:hypothetical protein
MEKLKDKIKNALQNKDLKDLKKDLQKSIKEKAITTDPHKDLLNKLNNITYDDKTVEQIKEYATKKKIPNFLSTSHRNRFIEKFRHYVVQDGKLFFKHVDFLLQVVKPEEVEDILKKEYADAGVSAGMGIYKFYRKLCDKYCGIKLKDVKEFLPKQQYYQLTKSTRHIVNKPILTERPNERWGIDLIDMNRYVAHNNNYRHILTCIDYFSKYCWAVPLKNKEAVDVVEGMDIITAKAGVFPDIIQKDNGGEFQKELNVWMKQHNVKYINTLSYSPQSNGLIENFNKQLRKILREMSVRTKSLNWVDNLQSACDSKNAMVNSTTKYAPNKLWTAKNNNRNFRQAIIKEKIKGKAKAMLDKITEFEIGDYVRIKMLALQSQIRQKIKNGNKKYIVVNYSPEIYQITSKMKKDNDGYENYRYTVKDTDGNELLTQLKRNKRRRIRKDKRFFASDFIKVDSPKEEPDILTRPEANKLNQIEEEIIKKPTKKKAVTVEPLIEPVDDVPIVEPIIERPKRARKQRQDDDFEYTPQVRQTRNKVTVVNYDK